MGWGVFRVGLRGGRRGGVRVGGGREGFQIWGVRREGEDGEAERW